MSKSPQKIAPPAGHTMVRAASLEPTSYNEADQSFEVVWTTGATVRRYDWREGEYDETLGTATRNVRLERLNNGAPVLANHNRFSLDAIIGSVVPGTARMANGKGIARIRLADTPDVASIVAKVRTGHIRNVSVGYVVHAYEVREGDQRKEMTATDWEPLEVSLVPVPADPDSLIRSKETDMPTQQPTPQAPTTTAVTLTDVRSAAAAAGLSSDATLRVMDRHAATPLDRDSLTAEIGREYAARDEGQRQSNRITIVRDSGDATREGIEGALYARMSGRQPVEQAREFMGASILDMARALIEDRGERTRGLGADQVIQRAFHTTSDFPNLLQGAGSRYLIEVFQAAESAIKAVARMRTASDFRDLSVLKLSQAPLLEKAGEGGEIKSGTFTEGKEGYRLATFGKIFSLSRQAIINDDLNAFSDPLRLMARAAAETEAQELTALLLLNSGAGPNMADGKSLYHADHGNKAASGGAISVATLSAAREAMRSQKDLDGKTPLNTAARHLVVGPAKETEAEQVLAQLAAAKVADVNPFSGKLELKVDPRLSGNAWRLFADPAAWPVIEYAYLAGAIGPQLATRDGWEVLGAEFRVTLDFGCGIVDHRGTYLNPGN